MTVSFCVRNIVPTALPRTGPYGMSERVKAAVFQTNKKKSDSSQQTNGECALNAPSPEVVRSPYFSTKTPLELNATTYPLFCTTNAYLDGATAIQ